MSTQANSNIQPDKINQLADKGIKNAINSGLKMQQNINDMRSADSDESKALSSTKMVSFAAAAGLIVLSIGFVWKILISTLTLQIFSLHFVIDVIAILFFMLMVALYEVPTFMARILSKNEQAEQIVSKNRGFLDHLMGNQQTRGFIYVVLGLFCIWFSMSNGSLYTLGLVVIILSGVAHIYIYRTYQVSVLTTASAVPVEEV